MNLLMRTWIRIEGILVMRLNVRQHALIERIQSTIIIGNHVSTIQKQQNKFRNLDNILESYSQEVLSS